jgi:hypothetical protein
MVAGPLTRAMQGPLPQPGPLANALASPRGERDWLDKLFLTGLRGAEAVGIGGTPLKLYNDVVQRGRREPITERDFAPQDLDAYRAIIAKKGAPEGHVDYPDYGDNTGSLRAALGGFNYKGDEITDNYDFNTDRGSPGEGQNLALRALVALVNPVGMASYIGRKTVPPGAGVPVRINLGQQGR